MSLTDLKKTFAWFEDHDVKIDDVFDFCLLYGQENLRWFEAHLLLTTNPAIYLKKLNDYNNFTKQHPMMNYK